MAYTTENIRNIVLLGHHSSGKTTLAETMLFESGKISKRGSVENGDTISDYTFIEKDKEYSVFTSLMNIDWRGNKINLVDTPGSDDFIGEILSALKVTDTALLLLNSSAGVEVGTEVLWDTIQEEETPTILVINQLDHPKASYDNTLTQAQEHFGSGVLPIQFPVNEGEGFNTIIDALRMKMYVFPEGGGKPQKMEIPDEYMDRANAMHNAIVEAAAENDEELMELYFEKGSLSEEELTLGLRMALTNQQILPVFCVSALKNMGSGRVMGFINDIASGPQGMRDIDGNMIECDVDGPALAFVYKTMTEPQVGRVSYFKVVSGKIQHGDELTNLSKGSSERINQLYVCYGKERTSVNELIAGDLGVSLKLKNTFTNDSLSAGKKLKPVKKIHFPEPLIRSAIKDPGKMEFEKMVKALHNLQEEDPTLTLEHNPELKQTLLHGQGQLHLDLAAYRIEKTDGIKVEFEEPKVPLRETITGRAEVNYRHKKQSGGAGQFAEINMRIEPYTDGAPLHSDLTIRNQKLIDLPQGGNLDFVWCIVGGAIDSRYMNAIEKGILMEMENGPLTGFPCQNIRVYITDGKMHSVDSNDMAFQIAASSGFKSAMQQANPIALEPIYELSILCSQDVMGDIMSDLQSRQGVIMGMDTVKNYQSIKAEVPLSELYQYSSTLRSLTQGKAKFSRKFKHYRRMSPEAQAALSS